MKHYYACSLASLLLAGTALADTPINETRAVNADARIEISNVKGAVTVSAWDKAEVAISGTLGEGTKPLLIEGGAAHLTIKVQSTDQQGWFNWGSGTRMGDTLLDVKVPRNAEMKIDVVSAEVSVAGVAGRTLDVDSVSGDVDLNGTAERTHLESVSGNLRARGLAGEMKFETVSGDIDAEGGVYREIGAGTVSGDINLRGTPAPGARVDVETMSGDVHLYLPTDVSARLRASTFSGSIRSDFGKAEEPEHGPGSSLDTTQGSGGGQIGIETFSGDIEIRSR